jgi:hypothetical protein
MVRLGAKRLLLMSAARCTMNGDDYLCVRQCHNRASTGWLSLALLGSSWKRTSNVAQVRTHWTKEKVLEEISALRDSGTVPSGKQIAKLRPALFGAAQRLLGGWRNALIAAGIDPAPIAAANRRAAYGRRTRWTQSTIIEALQLRHAAGKGLDVTALRTDRLGSLLTAAKRIFGSYEKAVGSAGLDYSDVRLVAANWSSDSVIQAIHDLDDRGSDLNISAAQHAQSSLVTAAIKHFGSWDAALRTAGFDPSSIRLDVNTEAGKGRVFENLCDALFSAIRPHWRLNFRHETGEGPLLPDAYDPACDEWIDFKLAAWGMSVNSSIRKYMPFASRLRFVTLQGERSSTDTIRYQSVFEYQTEATTPELAEIFETMRQLAANRVPPTRLAIWSRVWSSDQVIAFIRSLPTDQRNSSHCQSAFRREYSAAVRTFGSWSEALEAAGIDPDLVKRRRDAYTKEDVDKFIRGRAARGERLDVQDVSSTPSGNGLYQASQRFYNDWPSALRANDVDPDAVSGYALSRHLTLDRLIEFIRARHRAGEPLNAQYIRDNFKAEYKNALRLAGGWRESVERAGISYADVSSVAPPQYLSKEQVDQYIRDRHKEGLLLTTTAVRADNRAIHTAALRRHYGSWKAALEANGIAYRDPRKKIPRLHSRPTMAR